MSLEAGTVSFMTFTSLRSIKPAKHVIAQSLRSRRKHKAWGVSPRIRITESIGAREAGERAVARSAGLAHGLMTVPGAYTPGFTLTSASRTQPARFYVVAPLRGLSLRGFTLPSASRTQAKRAKALK